MIPWIAAASCVLVFILLVRLLGLVRSSASVVALARHTFQVIRSPSLGDDEKERELQKIARRLFRLFFVLALGGVLALALPMAVLWVGDRLGWVSFAAVLDAIQSPWFILVGSLLVLGVFVRSAKGNQ